MKIVRFCVIWLITILIMCGLSGCGDKLFLSVINNSDSKYNVKYQFANEYFESIETNLYVNKIGTYNNGNVISLTLPQTSGIPEDRLLLGYFWLKGGKIYKLNLGYKENFNSSDLNDSVKMETRVQEASVVFQDEPIEDSLGLNVKGWHQYLIVDGDKREYRAYNNQVETGYYESLVWELEKGLVKYKSGFGAESQSIELNMIE